MDAKHLLQFNCALIERAMLVIDAYVARHSAAYPGFMGPQMRHVIEHYEAIASAPRTGIVDYDGRQRDRTLECDPAAAIGRLSTIARLLADWTDCTLEQPVRLRAQVGLDGEFQTESVTSIGRELLFLASHTVHHFALLIDHCKAQSVALPANFGKAPATVAHEQASARLAAAPDRAAQAAREAAQESHTAHTAHAAPPDLHDSAELVEPLAEEHLS